MERISEENNLQELLSSLDNPCLGSFCHGTTDENVAKMILETGLQSRMRDIRYTTLPVDLNNPDTAKLFSNYSVRGANESYIIIVQIPLASSASRSTATIRHYNRVLIETPFDLPKIWNGGGTGPTYLIPKEFIRGYVDITRQVFVDNPSFNEAKQILTPEPEFIDYMMENIKKEVSGLLDDDTSLMPLSSDDLEVW